MIQNLEYALRTMKATMHHHDNDAYFPYFFIVGAGISVPEIPSASKIVDICKEAVKEIDPDLFKHYEEASKGFASNGMRYYSSWIEYAYPNKINRSKLFKSLCSKAKISSANLMLAQILHANEFANTVFTTNFDDSIKKALELMGTKNFFCAENLMDNLVVSNQTKDIQVIHVHGTFNFYDCANLEKEIDHVASNSGTISSAQLLSSFLSHQAPIIVGYSGWENDVIMRCLKERLTYPTPLQYIWICYNKQSYLNLPDWIKNSDSVIFVVPELDSEDCGDSCDSNAWDNSSNNESIDATMFFKRIISTFKLKTPLIFTNPYSYYSQKINSLLPADEDVLHLRHWTQRLKIVESDDAFEKLLHEMENMYIAKDYEGANVLLSQMTDLTLSEVNAEFVCTGIIKEFIRDEEIIPSLDLRLKFHFTSLNFIEKNIAQLDNTNSLISTLREVLFTRFKNADKEKIIELLDIVIDLAKQEERLLLIELIALGLKSSLVSDALQSTLLTEVNTRCPDINGSKDFAFLKFKALRDLACAIRCEDSIALIDEAASIIPLLGNDIYWTTLSLAKSEILPHITSHAICEKWGKEIIELLLSPNEEIDSDVYIEIAANLSLLHEDVIFRFTSSKQFVEIGQNLLQQYCVDQSTCHSILHYSQCCELLCRLANDDTMIADFSCKVLEVMDTFPHVCRSYLSSLFNVALKYISLPTNIVADSNKINIINKMGNCNSKLQ